jgi:hypothetical protein
MLRQLTGWQRDTALIQLGLGARYGEITGPPTTSISAVASCTSAGATPLARREGRTHKGPQRRSRG